MALEVGPLWCHKRHQTSPYIPPPLITTWFVSCSSNVQVQLDSLQDLNFCLRTRRSHSTHWPRVHATDVQGGNRKWWSKWAWTTAAEVLSHLQLYREDFRRSWLQRQHRGRLLEWRFRTSSWKQQPQLPQFPKHTRTHTHTLTGDGNDCFKVLHKEKRERKARLGAAGKVSDLHAASVNAGKEGKQRRLLGWGGSEVNDKKTKTKNHWGGSLQWIKWLRGRERYWGCVSVCRDVQSWLKWNIADVNQRQLHWQTFSRQQMSVSGARKYTEQSGNVV